jgi:hypothetical protein
MESLYWFGTDAHRAQGRRSDPHVSVCLICGRSALGAARPANTVRGLTASPGCSLETEHLQVAMEGRETNDLAKGIIMNSLGRVRMRRSGCW